MLRRRTSGAILALLLLLFTFASGVHAQARSVFWERWDTVIDQIDTTENRFTVTEHYDLYFTGRFTFGSRVIADDQLEGISNVQVFQDGQPLQRACANAPGTYCVQQVQEGTSVTYYFRSPIADDRANFTIQYTVEGALRAYEGGDQLWWIAIPEEHFGFSIGSAEIRVELPEGFGPREGVDPVVTYGVPADVDVRGTTVVATARQTLGGNDTFEIRVQYPHDPNAQIAGWQADFDTRRDFEETVKPLLDLVMLVLGAVLAIAGPLGVYYLWYSRGRDPKIGPVPEYLSEPPSDLPPAVVGSLIDEQAQLRDVLSTLVHLAQRGYLVIEEEKKAGLFGIGGGNDFTFKRTEKALEDLRPFEQRFMTGVFSGGKIERSMDSLKNKFYVQIPKLQEDLYDEMVKEGFFKRRPSTVRAIWMSAAAGILAIAAVFGFLLISMVEQLSGSLLCIPAAIAVSGIAMLLVGSHMPVKTRKGAEEAAKWRAFEKYMTNLEKYGSLEEAASRFDEYLPYAVAFGVDRSWIRRFANARDLYVPWPTWYWPRHRYGYGYPAGRPMAESLPRAQDVLPGELASAGGGGGLNDLAGGLSSGLESISDGLTDMLNSASRTLNSRPQSTSGSSGSWGSGGSSWSGGGSFGGGGSGGGSSGFG